MITRKYFATMTCRAGGSYRKSFDTLEEVREWVKQCGEPGETFTISHSNSQVSYSQTIPGI